MAIAIALLVLCPFAVTLGYIGLCAGSPWKPCARCRNKRRSRHCRACNGTGLRQRAGWQVWVYLTRFGRSR